jgi:hypothetical protein
LKEVIERGRERLGFGVFFTHLSAFFGVSNVIRSRQFSRAMLFAKGSAGLSKQQMTILNRVAEGGLPCICVSALREGDPKTQADSASFSRSVSRLDRRGLLRSIVFHYAHPRELANALLISPARPFLSWASKLKRERLTRLVTGIGICSLRPAN